MEARERSTQRRHTVKSISQRDPFLTAAGVVAVIGIAVPLAAGPAQANHASPSLPKCVVGVQVWEDGTWSGSSVWLNGHKVAHQWEVGRFDAPDRTYVNAQRQVVRVMGGFPADHAGKVCSTYIGK